MPGWIAVIAWCAALPAPERSNGQHLRWNREGRRAKTLCWDRFAWPALPEHTVVGQGIPRILWQTAPNCTMGADVAVLVASRQLVEENVGYVRIIVTDRAMEYFMDRPVRAAVPAVADAFFHISTDFMAARADLWRYAVLYLHGGAYLDMDGAVHGLDRIIERGDEAVLSRERVAFTEVPEVLRPAFQGLVGDTSDPKGTDDQVLVNWLMIFRPAHPLLREALEVSAAAVGRYQNEHTLSRLSTACWLTGPELLTLVWRGGSSSHDGVRLYGHDFERQATGLIAGARASSRPGGLHRYALMPTSADFKI